MNIHIREGDIHRIDIRLRMPFKYGIATMTSTPHVFVRLFVDVDGQPSVGIAADDLPPKWFTKDPDRALDEEVGEMLRVVQHALQAALDLRGDTPFEVWRQFYNAQAAWGRNMGLPSLLTNFGTTLVERAMIEAVCRAIGEPFHHVLTTNKLGIRLGNIHPELEGVTPAEFLTEQPLTRIIARHTIGLADPLEDADIIPAEPVDDGLPRSLAACIQTYGLRHFKVKISGDLGRDKDRLRRIASVIQQHVSAEFAFSLDGNEQFHSRDEFRTFWDTIRNAAELRPLFDHLMFVEQPFHRSVALEHAIDMTAWTDRPMMIIDESDAELISLPRALELGYVGTSHKNCKGIFKGVANACLLAQFRQRQPGKQFIMSGEDLVNLGPVALLQDLAVCASLGIESVERNGHHYVAGLSHLPAAVQEQMLQAHSDLYHRGRDGWPTLTIRDGRIDLHSIVAAPFGVGFQLEVEQFTPAGETP